MSDSKQLLPLLSRGQTFTPKERVIQTGILALFLLLIATLLTVVLDTAVGTPKANAVITECVNAQCTKSDFTGVRKAQFKEGEYGSKAKNYDTFPAGRYFTNPVYAKNKLKQRLGTYFDNHPKKQTYDGEKRTLEWWYDRAGLSNCVSRKRYEDFLKVEKRADGKGCAWQFVGGDGDIGYMTKQEFKTAGNVAICGGLVVLGWYSGGMGWQAALGAGACGWNLYWDSQN